ncbi:HTH_38 domain-containing protein [Trichonephila clavipes]|nr:HTH_38 domain-containing protein [Trichonephila clavipes]
MEFSVKRGRSSAEHPPSCLSERHFVYHIPQTEKKTIPSRQSIICCSKRDSKGDKVCRFRRFQVRQLCFSSGFFKERSVMSRRKERSAFDQVSEFDRGRIVAYRSCGLSFRKIGSRVRRNQTTVKRICDVGCRRVRWTDVVNRIHLSAPLHDVHCLVYPRRRATDISAANGAIKEGCERQNGMKLSLLTSHASVCNTTMVRFESGETVKRGG